MAFEAFPVYFVPTGADAATRRERNLVVAFREVVADANAYAALQAHVDAAVAEYGAGGLTAHDTAVDLPWWALPGQVWLDVAGDTLLTEPPPLYPGRAAVQTVHERYDELWGVLQQLGPSYPPEDVTALEGLLFRLHGGIHDVFSSALTPQEMLGWLAQQALGPADAGYDPGDPVTIAPIIDAIPLADRALNGSMFIASPGPAIRNGMPPLGTRLTLAQTFMADNQTDAANLRRVADLRGGDWIEEIAF